MKSSTTNGMMFFIFLQLNTSHLLNETSVSKVVCFYNRFKTVDLLLSSRKSWSHKLSKTLFQQCSIRIKSGFEVSSMKNDFVGFANKNTEIRELSKLIRNRQVTYGIIFFDEMNQMDELQTRIDQEIIFVNTNSWKVYEHYIINNQKIKNELGFFNSSFHYNPIIKKPFLNRRSNFQGYKLKSMTENSGLFIQIDLNSDTVQFDNISDTYEVSQSRFWRFFYLKFRQTRDLKLLVKTNCGAIWCSISKMTKHEIT